MDGGQESFRSCTMNISWGGMFILDMNPERYSVGQHLKLSMPDFELETDVSVVWIKPWGQRKPPGIGLKFLNIEEKLEHALVSILRSNKGADRDRLIA
jgi:Tfp pilus assembly protein PilZ